VLVVSVVYVLLVILRVDKVGLLRNFPAAYLYTAFHGFVLFVLVHNSFQDLVFSSLNLA
jgi:hypothetical protein